MRTLWCSTALVVIALLQPAQALAGPEGGLTVGGSATISRAGTTTTINQTSNRAIIDWRSFDVQSNESVNFVQPSRGSIAVNRIHDSKASQINGSVTANGSIMLLNQNGVLFGNTARVDVGGLIAGAGDLANPNEFMAGAAARIEGARSGAAVINRGRITIAPGGLAGFVAPSVENSGLISAQLGRVHMGAGDLATIDMAGDGLIEIAMRDDDLARSLKNSGSVQADGGAVLMTAATARGMVESLIDNTGTVRSDSVGSARGSVKIKGNGATIKNTGTIVAQGQAGEQGGSIAIDGAQVSLGGTVSTQGIAGGGDIDITAGVLSLAGLVDASSTQGAGGRIDMATTGNIWATSSATMRANGYTAGGAITQFGGRELVTSATYSATSSFGAGGLIDISAPAVKTLSAHIEVSGGTRGGQIRIGGEYQGGKGLPLERDEVPNATIVTLDRGTRLRADGENADSEGGRVIVWSDLDTLALADILARPGTRSGAGGFVELSSGGELGYGATIQTGRGTRSGQVLLDPKNITITEGSLNPTAIIMGRGYVGDNIDLTFSEAHNRFGYSIALDGTQMAVGYHTANSADGMVAQTGAVYLYTFSDTSFSGATLQGIVGHGYTGGKNVDLSSYLQAQDGFGVSVSLDGNRLAVGAHTDDGNANSNTDSGSVYLLSFSDGAFSGGTLRSVIGSGYTGGSNYNLSGILGSSDNFGRSVSLDGDRLAVGASAGDGVTNGVNGAGEVYLFSFASNLFATPTLEARIGAGYTGGKNINQALGASDSFGVGVSLSGNRLAVGASGGDGATNSVSASGEVYLYSFTDSLFSGGVLESTIGVGYTGGKNVDLTGVLGASDAFGYAVSLDGNRLAIGSQADDGNANGSSNSGAVYLYSFADSTFTTPTLEARIGANYAALGGKNLSRANEAGGSDNFGTAVALDGNRLAVGAIGDDGTSNLNSDQGAYHFYTFSDSAFTGGTWQATLGTGYTGGKNITFATGTSGDTVVSSQMSVSLDNNRIAIGMPDDDGFGNTRLGSGAVYLYSFASNEFDGAVLQSIIGSGYTGGKNIDLSSFLGADDRFGWSVSLNGNRLAVGAPYDDGNANALSNSGAAYLFSFSDSLFSGGTLQSRIGRNYTGGKNFNPANLARASDYFGSSIALDGNRLAVGAYGDDGAADARSASGAVYLFTFADSVFSTPTQRGIIGYNYTGVGNYNIADLAANDYLGYFGLSLDGNRLGVVAYGDDGFNNTMTDSGAAYLFSFADSIFSTPTLQATAGYGYTGGKNINMSMLAASDALSGIALEAGTLALGANLDDGVTNGVSNAGAVYLYSFTDTLFNGAALDATIGSGYTGGNNINLASQLTASDFFGRSLDLNGGTLVIATPGGDGAGNLYTATGEVYIFRSSGYLPSAGSSFTNLPSSNIGITPASLVALLSTPQDVILQANNDITVNSNIIVNNASGNGGTLTLQAGRSIILNANITTDSGNLNLYANEDLSSGVVNAQRDAGAATITMAAGTAINAGAGAVHLRLEDGTGKTNNTSGNIVLNNITAGSLLVHSVAPTSSVIINGTLSASGAGTPLSVAAGKDFINNFGATALNTPSGRWIVYSDSPVLNTLGGLSPAFSQYLCTYGGACTPGAGNGMFYEYGTNLLSVSVDTSRYYGDANPTTAALQSVYIYKGFQNGDTASVLDVLPTATVAGSATATAAAGSEHGVTLSGGSDNFYQYYFLDASSMDITKKPITVTWDGVPTKEYGDLNPDILEGDFIYSGFANGDTETVLTDFSVDFGTIDENTNAGSYTISASMLADNYIFSVPTSPFVIAKRGITATWNAPLTRTYGAANPTVNNSNFTFSGFVNGDTASVMTSSANYTGITATTNAGTYNINGVFTAANYTITNAPQTTLTINKKDITATVGSTSRAYGDANPALTWANVTWAGFVNAETGAVIDAVTVSAPTALASSNAGSTHAITLSGFSDNNYNLTTVTNGTLTINKRNITATVNNASRAYGDANPSFTWADVTWNNLANSETGAVIDAATIAASTATATSNAGTTHAITLSGFSDNNYNLTGTTNGTLTINKRNITATVNNASRAYGDSNPAFTWANVTWNNLANSETGAVIDAATIAAPTALTTSNAGTTHAINLTGFSDNNYNLTSLTNGTLTINKRDITATVNNASRAYGDTNPAFTWANVTWNNLANSETGAVIDAATIAAPTALATSNAGTTHAITLSGFSDNNYNLTGTTNGTLTINKRNITATVNNASRAYGDANPSFGWADVVWSNLANSETGAVIDAATIAASTATATSNAGTTHAITLSGFSDDNYNLTGTTNGALTINKRNITATVNNASRAYGDANPSFGWADVVWSNLANSETGAVIDAATIAAPTATVTSNAGTTHTIALSGFSDNNYNLTGATNGTLTINKRDITATVNNASRAYGDANPTFTWANVTWNNLANSQTGAVIDAVTVAAPTAIATSDAGTTHAINLTGFSDNNYNLTGLTNGTLTITKRNITAAVNNASRVYGDANPAFDWSNVTWNNLANGETGAVIDTATIAAPTALATSNAGTTHAIALSGFSDNNYNLTSVSNGTLTIGKRNITATVNGATRAYGDANPILTWADVTWNNLANGETGAVIDAVTVAAASATAASNAGTTHAITLSGFSDNNYNLTSTTTSGLTITKRNITAVVNDASRAYGAANPALNWSNVTWSNLANGQSGAVIDSVTVDAATATAASGAGSTHAITLSAFADNNYALTSATDGTLTVTKRDITATVGNASRAYGDANPTFDWSNVTWGNLANGDTGAVIDALTVSAVTATATSNAGTAHAITLAGFSDDNYNLTTNIAGSLTITKRDITAAVNDASRVYGDANPALSWADVVWSNLANGETGSVINALTVSAPTANAATNAGTSHAITLTGFSDNNYNLTGATNGTLTIAKRDITASVNNASRAYGDANPVFDWSDVVWGNLANGQNGSVIDAVTVDAATANATSNAGSSHAITLGGFSDNNYNLTGTTNGTLTITKAGLVLRVDNATKSEQTANPAFTYTLTGLRNGETSTVLGGVSLGTAATTASPAGTYAITASGGTAINYDVTSYINGVLTITSLTAPPVTTTVPSTVNQTLSSDGYGGNQDGYNLVTGNLTLPQVVQPVQSSTLLGGSYIFIPDQQAYRDANYSPSTLVAVTERLKRLFRLN